MKRAWITTVMIGAGAIWSAPVGAHEFAGGEVSGSVAVLSDYIFRGISQTGGDPALQGDLSWTHASGFYAGIWASNTDAAGPGNSVEIDPYVGFAAPLGETGFDIDAGVWFYFFPGAEADLDYWEAYVTLSYGFEALTLSASLWYADDYFGSDFFSGVSALAYEGIAEFTLPEDFSVSGTLGRQTFDGPAGLPGQDFTYYDIGMSKAWQALTFDLRWHDADGVRPDLAAPGDVGALVASVSFGF